MWNQGLYRWVREYSFQVLLDLLALGFLGVADNLSQVLAIILGEVSEHISQYHFPELFSIRGHRLRH